MKITGGFWIVDFRFFGWKELFIPVPSLSGLTLLLVSMNTQFGNRLLRFQCPSLQADNLRFMKLFNDIVWQLDQVKFIWWKITDQILFIRGRKFWVFRKILFNRDYDELKNVRKVSEHCNNNFEKCDKVKTLTT